MKRVVAVDVARGLAILAMFAAHVGNRRSPLLPNGSSWIEFADGRSSAGFALLAGVSAALLSGGPEPATGSSMRYARVRILVRALLLWPIGAAMIALNTPVVVILPSYAVMFAVMACVLHWSQRALLATAALVLAVAPPLVFLARDLMWSRPEPPLPIVDVVAGDYYPAAVWIAYLLIGLVVGRMDLRAPSTPRILAVAGLGGIAAGYGISALVLRHIGFEHTLQRAVVSSAPHDDSAFEVIGNSGVVLVVLAVCLWIVPRFSQLLIPIAATGALSLTAYCGHIVAIAVMDGAPVFDATNRGLASFVVVTLVATTAWRMTLGKGPLERLLHAVSTRVADRLVPQGRRRADPEAVGTETRCPTSIPATELRVGR